MLQLGEPFDEHGLLGGDRPGLGGRGVGSGAGGAPGLPSRGGRPPGVHLGVLGLLGRDVREGRGGTEPVVVGVQRTLGVLQGRGLLDDLVDAVGADDRGERGQPRRELVGRHQRVAVGPTLPLHVAGGDPRASPGVRCLLARLRGPPPGAVVGLGGLGRPHGGLLEPLVRDHEAGPHRGDVPGLVAHRCAGLVDVVARGRLVRHGPAGEHPTGQDRRREPRHQPERSHRAVPISVTITAPRGTPSTLDTFRHKRNISPHLSQTARRVGLTNYIDVIRARRRTP